MLSRWPSIEVAGRGLPASASAGWTRSTTTSPPSNGRRLKDAWNGCAYCGATDGALQRDCVMAISRGGRYTVDNVVPACASCNTSKCNDEVTGWMRRKRLDERRFLTRYIEIRAALTVDVS